MAITANEPPRISLAQLDESPFDVTLNKFSDFWLVPLEVGQHGWSTSYEYPGPTFWERREHRVKGPAKVHGITCLETETRHYDADGNLSYTNVVYQNVDRGYLRRYGAIFTDKNGSRLSTWKDNDFEVAWGYDPGTPLRVVDVGRWRWLDATHFTDGAPAGTPDGIPAETPRGVNPNGAGLWEVRVGERTHRCLRVLEPDSSAEGILVETFVVEDGNTVLARRYNGSRWHYGTGRTLIDGEPHEWTEVLPDAPRLYYNDICFVLWDFSIPDEALAGA